MRKSVSPAGLSLGEAEVAVEAEAEGRLVFGVPLEQLQMSGQPGRQVPLLVRHIVEYIQEHGELDMEGVFLVNGNAERVEWLRQRYDNREEVDLQKEADVASAVSLLRLFLQEMPQPLIPISLQIQVLQVYQEYSSEEELWRSLKCWLQQLPALHYSLLRFLCRFLAGVASLQTHSWSLGTLAAVFGADIFHSGTELEELKEQDSVSRVLADLLENQEELFDSDEEDDEVSTTNDYSSVNEQITELLEDERVEACEELPRDAEEEDEEEEEEEEDAPGERLYSSSTPPETDSGPSSSHISSISILPGSADIIQRTIRAAVEQHFLELKTGQTPQSQCQCVRDPDVKDDECDHSEGEEPSSSSNALEQAEMQDNQEPASEGCVSPSGTLEGSGMELDSESLVDTENNINTARQENFQSCEEMELTDVISCDDELNANTEPDREGMQLRNIFPNGEWEDPVPASKVWQGDSEGGEAQLSPLASRMLPLPLEDDAQPLLARRFLDFGSHSQRFFQQDPENTSPTKALSAGRQRRASLSSKESAKGDAVAHQLTKKLQNLKKKIRQFEEQFEKEKNYKPSHGDKAANPKVLKWMTDLTKIRKQIKGRQLFRHQALHLYHRRLQASGGGASMAAPSPSSSSSSCSSAMASCSSFSSLSTHLLHHPPSRHHHPPYAHRQGPHLNARQRVESELAPQARPRSNTLPKSFGSSLDSPAAPSEGSEVTESRPTRHNTLDLIQQRLKTKRQEEGWPQDVKKMTKEQLAGEKTVLQKNLLHYEGLHGRPVTREERLIVKPLYDRYRLIKQMITRVSITPIIASPTSKRRNMTLQPIIEGETAHFCDEITEEEEENRGEEEEEEQDSSSEEKQQQQQQQRVISGEKTSGVDVRALGDSSDVIVALDPAAQPPSQQPLRHVPGDETRSGKMALDLRLSSSHASSMPELLEQLWKARAEKKKLRRTIREFEDDFYQQNGRTAQKEDRLPMMDEYKEYKRIKAKLRLLEVLISKQDSSKSI
ncbi:protein FAM13B isoform X2 [Engraulis encrasicolus]|uniref:protein FAM13B isoform X2 n=1 Tax=Engraulis encrasicolus TaxID=184585 RepID=UPI002FD44E0A